MSSDEADGWSWGPSAGIRWKGIPGHHRKVGQDQDQAMDCLYSEAGLGGGPGQETDFPDVLEGEEL